MLIPCAPCVAGEKLRHAGAIASRSHVTATALAVGIGLIAAGLVCYLLADSLGTPAFGWLAVPGFAWVLLAFSPTDRAALPPLGALCTTIFLCGSVLS